MRVLGCNCDHHSLGQFELIGKKQRMRMVGHCEHFVSASILPFANHVGLYIGLAPCD
jgi:hypothetical protein